MTVLLPLPAAIPGWCVTAIIAACGLIVAALIVWRHLLRDLPERGDWDCWEMLAIDVLYGRGHVTIVHDPDTAA